jgi:hypothetical protein
MKICVLQPDCSQAPNSLDFCTSSSYFSHLEAEDTVDYVLLNKATIYRQLKTLKKSGYDIFINLCRGYSHWETPSCYEVMMALESLNLPYTGSATIFYASPKQEMKHIAYFAGIDTPSFSAVETLEEVGKACSELNFPLFVKPATTGDGLGIDERSLTTTKAELLSKAAELIAEFDTVLIEEYIAGREFTVVVVTNPDNPCEPIVYQPIEFVPPKNEGFSTYNLKLRQHHPECYIPCNDHALELSLREAARRLFVEMQQGSYASIDFKVDEDGEIFFLEVNAPCAVFGTVGHETVADYVLHNDALGHVGFIQHIIKEGITRHQQRQKKYRVGESPIATYGIFATQAFKAGDVIVAGEARPQRIVTRSYIHSHWTEAEKDSLLRYVYPLGKDILVLRNANPGDWILQNHSCDPNTAYQGFDLIALQDISAGEELTVDFATFCGENMEGFECMCGSTKCRGAIHFASCAKDERTIVDALNFIRSEALR